MDKPVASIIYNFSGARKTSTDPTAQPFAYNGETRDDTGLDYLRARYYDSQGGAFLTEDSYPGEDADPFSARTVTVMCRTTPSTIPTRVGTSGTVSKKAGTMLKRRYLMHGMVKNILMKEINNEYKSDSFKKKRTF